MHPIFQITNAGGNGGGGPDRANHTGEAVLLIWRYARFSRFFSDNWDEIASIHSTSCGILAQRRARRQHP